MAKIGVLVVDDSVVSRNFITGLIAADPTLSVVGSASNGVEAVAAVERLQPDVVLMDINMPLQDGFAATRAIMDKAPRPIILISAMENAQSSSTIFAGMEAGALAVLARPHGHRHPQHDSEVRELLRTLKTLSAVKVVRRRSPDRPGASRPLTKPLAGTSRSPEAAPAPSGPTQHYDANWHQPLRLVAVGASTGGPPVIRTIIAGLPRDFPLPLIVVQHISAGFTSDFVRWLVGSTGYPVSIAGNGEQLLPGRAYIAPEGAHTTVTPDLRAVLSMDPPEYGMRPAVSTLFRSVATSFGSRAMGVLLTGMGQDGSAELVQMRQAGAITIAQDAESSVVFGMPGEAIRLGGAAHVCSADDMPGLIVRLARSTSRGAVDDRR